MRSYWDGLLHRRFARRRVLAAAAGTAAGLAALATGCSGGKEGGVGPSDEVIPAWRLPDETDQAIRGGVYRGRTASDVTGGLDPVGDVGFTTLSVVGTVYESALRLKAGPGVDPTLARDVLPALAESYEANDDATSFTFRMRQGVRFHNVPPVNGRVMDIDDWRQSHERFIGLSPNAVRLTEIVDKIEFPDSRTMVVKTKFPYGRLPIIFASGARSFYIMPKEAADGRLDPFTQVIGTGYRRLSRLQRGVDWEYTRHDSWWMKDRPFIDRWRIAIVPEYANALAQFITGNILEFAPQQTDVPQVRKDVPQARMFRGEVTQSYRINHFGRTDFDTSPWRDDRVRRAMSMVLDRDPVRDHFSNRAEFEAAGLTLESRTHTHIPAYMTAYWADPKAGKLGPQSKFFLYDLAEAKRLMAAAGHAAGIEIDAFMNAGSEFGTAVYPQLVQLTVDQLNRSGLFRTRLERLPYAEYFRRIQRDRAFKGVALQQPDLGDDVDLLIYRIYHTKGIRFYSVPDPKVDDFIERQRRELDEDKRVAILLDFQKYMADMMYTFPGDGVSNTFHFKWPWLRNSAWPAWNEWLSADMPNRDG